MKCVVESVVKVMKSVLRVMKCDGECCGENDEKCVESDEECGEDNDEKCVGVGECDEDNDENLMVSEQSQNSGSERRRQELLLLPRLGSKTHLIPATQPLGTPSFLVSPSLWRIG
ncbi:hypothetical protein Pcinc_028829 [Petrolisthes cinctipes]|uniref:Uncharacterized protein n=1 Tax=Petrolisthes cinctipes TaxID=88211 RepID=A0AAE1F1M0_PETCI|nr:hypothetical protein Pcinc_028829 [Petrolisthes cinctipes]